MRVLAAVVAVAALAGCGPSGPPVRGTWRDVLRDAAHGGLDTHWSCGSLRAAFPHLSPSPPQWSPVPDSLIAAEAKACDAAESKLRPGVTRGEVQRVFGGPSLAGQRCTTWKWTPGDGAIDGVRVCFRAGRAVTVISAQHG
jgi:hypothetical protein